YILDAAAAEAAQITGGQTPDLVVRLTIDPKLQAAGLEAVRWGVGVLGKGRRVSQGALVALDQDGAIRAMVGGVDHDKSAFNRVTQARRQPGSSFKAFVYGAAVERGVRPVDVRQDAPVALGNWNPENYGGRFSGPVTVAQALARSINTVSVRLTEEVGPDAVAEFARRCGLTDIPPRPGPSIALGAYEVTLLELAGGYQVFQTGGGRQKPYLIESIGSTSGQSLFARAPSAPTPVYDVLYATRMVGMMKGVISGGTGVAANIGRPAAGKTGTSQNWRDAWFVGFTPQLLAGVWVGNDDNRPMAKVTGGEIPAAIWKRFMTIALKDVPPTDFPWLVQDPQAEAPPTVEGGQPFVDEPPMLQGDQDADMTQPPGAQDQDDGAYADRARPQNQGDEGDEARSDQDYPGEAYVPPRRPGYDPDEGDEAPPPRRPYYGPGSDDARGGDGREQPLPRRGRDDGDDPDQAPRRYRY
ncbi:MAG TPA: penicillin-binding transpeptidase domain-containing protein, partial [Caulobacteraceae bacterium]|nr:penicillin-binding transpeptidase domain-containing protein [Caulobacteraceae bacterium]